jgi:hypothetical protein
MSACSRIHGSGVYATRRIRKGTPIASVSNVASLEEAVAFLSA